MKAILIVIAATAVIVLFNVSSRAQSVDVLQYSTAVAILKCDCYKDPQPPVTPCQSCPDSSAPCVDGGPVVPRFVAGELRLCHPISSPSADDSNPQFGYKLILRNEGQKTVRAVDWEYLFIDRDTLKEMARHQFHSEETICPGQRKTLVEYSTSPPTKVISVRALPQPEAEQVIERVAIKRDVSGWVRLGKPGDFAMREKLVL